MSEYMGGLPEGWVAAALGEVVDYGKSTKADPNQIDSETWVLELEDIERDSSKILQRMTFSERKSKSTKSAFKKGDVLYGKLRPYLNKVVIADTAGVCTTEIIPLSGGDHLDNHFLFHWLKHPTFTDYVTQVGRGVNMPRLGTEDGVLAPFILAPLAEQKVIADKLDALLAQVDTLKARLDAIPAILKRFRQSVLSAAVTGKLTEDWRSKNSAVQTISELPIQSKTRRGVPEDVRIPDRLSLLKYPESWALCSAAELLRKGVILDLKDGNHGANHPKTTEFTKQGLPFITAAQVTEDFKIDFDNAPKLSGHPLATLRVGFAEIGDVIFTHKGTVGRVAVTNRDCILSPQTTYYRLDQKYIIAEYLKFFLKSNVFVDQLDSVKSQTTRDFVPISTQYELFHLIPPPFEQTEIVHRVESLLAFADQIEARAQEATARVKHLTQSILAKAFRGELTEEWRKAHPELVSGENSADALLERIRTNRASSPEAKGKRVQKVSSEFEPSHLMAAESPTPKKRGRPPKR